MCSASVCDIKSGIDPCPLSYKTNGAYFCLKNQHLPFKQKKKKGTRKNIANYAFQTGGRKIF